MALLDRLIGQLRRLERRHWLALFAYGLAIYFGYHALSGSRGLLAWQELNRQLEATEQELADLRAERRDLEHKVGRLRASSLDPDLIDELARRNLSLVEPLDVIILLDEEGTE
ncbi:MAG: FtsB family cell division protein [Geminicoccaceae bacterium]